MTDVSYSGLTENTTGADDDYLPHTDKSDTAQSANGSTRWMSFVNFFKYILGNITKLDDHGTASSGTEDLDYDVAQVHKVEAGGDFTINITNWPASGVAADMEIVAVNWGAHTVTLPGSWNWGDAGVPTFTTSGRDRIVLRTDDGGTNVDAMLAGSGF